MKTFRTLACLSLVLAAPGAFAADKVCKLDIASTDQMTFDKKELSVAADCTSVELTLHHVGKMPAALCQDIDDLTPHDRARLRRRRRLGQQCCEHVIKPQRPVSAETPRRNMRHQGPVAILSCIASRAKRVLDLERRTMNQTHRDGADSWFVALILLLLLQLAEILLWIGAKF